MTLSMSAAAIPPVMQMLAALRSLVDKAEAYGKERKIDEKVLLEARLYPDMFAFVRQVQLATDFAKGVAARLSGREVPKFEDTEQSFAELRQRIDKTVPFVASVPLGAIDEGAGRDVTVRLRGQSVTVKGAAYLVHFALPNLYFHVAAAYAILRHSGVVIGKGDFLGTMPGFPG